MSKAPRSPLAVRVEKIRELAKAARECLAGELFRLTTVEEAMSAAAVKGLNTLTITPPRPVELRGTVAARELEAELAAAGVRAEWMPRRLAGSDSQPVSELVITW